MDLKSKACGKKLCMRAQNAVPSAQLVVKFSILMPCEKSWRYQRKLRTKASSFYVAVRATTALNRCLVRKKLYDA